MFNFFNKFLHETLFPHPKIILFFLHAKNCGTIRHVSSEYNSVTHRIVKKHDRLFLMPTLAPGRPMAYTGILFGGRGFQQIQLRTEGRENGDLGA